MHAFNKNELNSLFRYCCALTRQDSDAYDLLQSSLEKYLRKASQGLDKPQMYLRRIIRNTHIDNLRRNKVIDWETFDDEKTEFTDMGWQSFEQMLINADEVENIFKTLKGSVREILFLWAVEGYTIQEVADLIEIPKNSVLSKIYRMRQRIKAPYQSNFRNGVV